MPHRREIFPDKIHTVLRPVDPTEPLPLNLVVATGEKGQTLDLKLGDDIASAVRDKALDEATLKLRLNNFSHESDKLKFRLNGEPLPEPTVEHRYADCCFEFKLQGPPLQQGDNKLELILTQRNPRIKGPLVLNDVELLIKYK